MLYDCHVHCERSCDSKMKLCEATEKAGALGLGICITEHWDYDYPTNGEAFSFDLTEYKAAMDRVCNDKVLMGIEIGMQPHVAEKNAMLARSLDFDYVLCSIHCVQGKDLYEPECYSGLIKNDAVRNYLTDMYTCICSHSEIDSLGHVDYITRYWPYAAQLHLEDAPELWDRVFSELVKRDIPMEINTRQTDNPAVMESLREIYGRYHDLGGKYVTLGSDAHCKENVGKRIKEAFQFAVALNLIPVYYRQRKKIKML